MSAEHKRGDTFDRSGQVDLSEGGTPVIDMTGWTGRSQIRTSGGQLIAELDFSWLDASQRKMRLRKADTGTWPIGRAEIDIQFTSPAGDVVSTRTATIEIVKDVTRVT